MCSLPCRLCGKNPAINSSHILPKFVFRAIKSDSPTGFFRNPFDPNQRLQDGDKFSLLCSECEQRFSKAEHQFERNLFSLFHSRDRDEFEYGPWLHYFMTSLAWRALILDLPGLESDQANPRATIATMKRTAERMRRYLLGADKLAGRLSNHIFLCSRVDSASADLKMASPNVMIRRSVFGYSILDRFKKYSGVLHNLAGIMCFLVIKGDPKDIWKGTKVDSSGGELKQPQHVDSWLVDSLLSQIVQSAGLLDQMSEVQQEKVREAMKKNLSAPALRFRGLDSDLQ